jgi:type II secretion system protein C
MLGNVRTLGEILIVTLSAYYLALAAYNFTKPVCISPPVVENVLNVSKANKNINKSYFNIINSRNLFAAYDPANVVRKPKPKPKNDIASLPVASSKLRLSGTIYASEAGLRRAVVVVDGKTKVFKSGQKVKGFRINEIKRRAIVLAKGNKRELLMIDRDDKKIASSSDSGNVLLSKKKIQQALSKPEDILSKVDFAPAKVNGKKGLLINNLQSQSILANAGIRKGDLIVSVNGKHLQGLSDIMNLAKMNLKKNIEIKIWRQKRFETLKIKFSDA